MTGAGVLDHWSARRCVHGHLCGRKYVQWHLCGRKYVQGCEEYFSNVQISAETNYCKEYLPEIPFRNPDLQQTSSNLISVADFSVFDSKKSIKNRKSCRVTKL